MTKEQLAMLIQFLRNGQGNGLLQPQQPTQSQGGLLSPMMLVGDPRTRYTGTATVGTRG